VPTHPEGETAYPEVTRALVLVGARWRGLLQIVQQVLTVVATVVLARLLTPTDFGVVAAAMSVFLFFSLASAWGFGAAIIRKHEIDEPFLRGILAANLAMAVVLVGLGALIIPFVARLLAPGAGPAIFAVLCSMLIVSVSSVSMSLLERRMQFGRMSVAGVAATIVYIGVEIALAAAGMGYWAVIIGFLAMQVVQSAGYLIAAGWWPRLASPRHVLRTESRFSMGFFANEVTNYANKNIDYWIVAATLGTAALGSYYIAFVLPTILRLRVTTVVQQLLYPVFSRLRSDPERSRRAYESAMEFQAALGVPAVLGIVVVAEPVVRVFFGPQWQASVEPMRWIALAAVVDLLGTAVGQAAIAHGQVMRSVAVNLGRGAVLAILLIAVVLAGGGLTQVAMAVLAASVVALALGQIVIGRPLGLLLRGVAGPLLRIFAISVAMALLAWAAMAGVAELGAGPLVQLVAATAVGAVSYLGLGFAFGGKAYRRYAIDLGAVLGVRRLRRAATRTAVTA
jgi:O-antigen/teichoic acid export membrane protein